MLICSLWTFELPKHLVRNSRFWFVVPFPFFILWKEMDHFFACLTGPSADIAGGCVLVLINCTFSCNNFTWEPSWIGLVCSQYDAASHWYSEGKVVNTFLNLVHEFFFFFFKSEWLPWFCLGNSNLQKCILEGCRRFKQCQMWMPCFSQCTARHFPISVIIFRTTKPTGWRKNYTAHFCGTHKCTPMSVAHSLMQVWRVLIFFSLKIFCPSRSKASSSLSKN